MKIRDFVLGFVEGKVHPKIFLETLENFSEMYNYKKLYNSFRCMGEYEYSSPLVAKVTFLSANFPSVPSTFWKGWIEVLPEEFKECIKADPNYAECFE